MNGTQPTVSIIVPTLRRFAPVLDTLRGLLVQRYPALELIVADQNRSWPVELEAERDRLAADPRVHWMVLERPGVVVARNEAVARSRGEIIVFVDDDVEILDVDFIGRHVANYADPSVAAVAGGEYLVGQTPPPLTDGAVTTTTSFVACNPLDAVLRFDRSSAQRTEVCTFCTCNGSIRRSAFMAVGGFDESFGGNSYGDDYDLALRLEAAGFRIVYDPTARLVHLRAPMGGLRMTDPGNPFSERARVLSGALFYFRHARPPHRWNVFYGFVLRRSVLLRRNVVRPWREVSAVLGTALALAEASRYARRPHSRFTESSARSGSSGYR